MVETINKIEIGGNTYELEDTTARGKAVQSDWNTNDSNSPAYVNNRPFYKRTVLDISWDGNTEGLDATEGFPLYKVSGTAPEKNDILGSTIVFYNDGVQDTYEADLVGVLEGENYLMVGEFLAITYADNVIINSGVFPTSGTWFLAFGTQYTQSIKKLRYER